MPEPSRTPDEPNASNNTPAPAESNGSHRAFDGVPSGDRGDRRAGRDRRSRDPQTLGRLFEQLPPHSIESEMALLGAMILDANVIGEVLVTVKGAEEFYKPAHGAIFQSILELYDKHNVHQIDMVTLVDRLRDKGVLAEVGGPDYLAQLMEGVPSATLAKYYARTVHEKFKLRKLIEVSGDMLYDAYNSGDFGPEAGSDVLERAEVKIFEISQEWQTGEAESLGRLVQQQMDKIDNASGQITGLRTYYDDLDRMLTGLQEGEMIVVAARPSMGKCLAADAEITLADGSIATIEELVRRRSGEIATLDESLKLRWTSPSDFIDDGMKPVFEVTTRLGRRIKSTLTHPFRTFSGWKPLGRLGVGDFVAVPRVLEAFGSGEMRECEVKLLAYFIGDGGLTGSVPQFTNGNERIAADFRRAVSEFGGVKVHSSSAPPRAPSWRVGADPHGVSLARQDFAARLDAALSRSSRTAADIAAAVGVTPPSITHWRHGASVPAAPTFARLCEVLAVRPEELAPEGLRSAQRNTPNRMTMWLRDLGLMGHGAGTKVVPPCVFTLRRDLLALFLNRLFATDGWATVLDSGQPQIGYSSISEKLARQVQHLLLRFGVVAQLRLRWVKYRGGRRPAWQVDLTNREAILRFAERIGIFGKEEAVERAVASFRERGHRTVRDLIPMEAWDRIAAAKGEISWAELARRIGSSLDLHVGKRRLTRRRLAAIGEVLNDKGLLALARSDVYWDEIVSIEPLGPGQVYDLTVPRTHNFVANDVCVHNTALALNLCEQIAMGGPPGARVHPKVPVALFSLEMSKASLALRLLSAASGIPMHDLRSGALDDNSYDRVFRAYRELYEAPIFIDDTAGLSITALRARARRLHRQHKVRAIMVDYLQLLTAPQQGRESRQVEVSAISRGIKALARELNIPIICLSQLNRASEDREGNKPRMSDLRESGSIEQDADVIVLLHREEYYHIQNLEAWRAKYPDKVGLAELIVAKQRNGPVGTVKLRWSPMTTRFEHYNAGDNARLADDFEGMSRPTDIDDLGA